MSAVPPSRTRPATAAVPVTLPERAEASARRVFDRLLGTRLQGTIDRRVRREVRQHRTALTADLSAIVAEEVRRQLATAALERTPTGAEFTLDVLLGVGTRFDRTLSAERWAELAAEITALTEVEHVARPMGLAFRTLLDHETRGLGRIAGTSYNIVGKLTVPPLLAPPEGPVLEIGTLFGLFAPALVQQFRRAGEVRPLTVIDPLAGHQIQLDHNFGSDPSGTPVTAPIARHNFAVGGLGPDDVRLIEGFSTDPEVQRQAADQRYAVVVVDGDHSEEGVYADLGWVETVVAPGGLVVMDDFGDGMWPGVERATRRYLADGGRLQLLGQAATSAYLRQP